ncbi:MAG: response regulator [Magnetococcales bacterium]|nr:response regulator [Magnetococcales bacterium]
MEKACRILIADDSALARRQLMRLLQPLNAEMVEAKDGNEGLQLALSDHFDLIVTDFDMPHLDGRTLCSRLKELPQTSGIPVILVSAYDSPEEINLGFQAGASGFVSKTEAPQRLLDRVKKILFKARLQSDQLILVVEDTPTIQVMVKKALIKAGFQVALANNGQEAMHFLSGNRPDLILSDINMPVMDGFAFCESVHHNPELAVIPFVVMSTNSDRGHIQRMIQLGANTYIIKPFNLDQLVVLVEKLLSDQFLILLKEKERLEGEQAMVLGSITSLISALEARDEYTRGHSDAVSRISAQLAELAGLPPTEIQRIAFGGTLHDLGKIGVRDAVLLKPGKLTDEEFAQIKDHPVIGARILRPIPSLSDVIPIVLSHHEQFNGKGYPNGLKGEEIPFWARLTAVADIWHALVSDRPYRKGMPLGKALSIIEECRGNQLCPDCVHLFMLWVANKNFDPTKEGQDLW